MMIQLINKFQLDFEQYIEQILNLKASQQDFIRFASYGDAFRLRIYLKSTRQNQGRTCQFKYAQQFSKARNFETSENQIFIQETTSRIKQLENTTQKLIPLHGSSIENIENYLTRQTPKYLKISRWVASIVILIGVFLGGSPFQTLKTKSSVQDVEQQSQSQGLFSFFQNVIINVLKKVMKAQVRTMINS